MAADYRNKTCPLTPGGCDVNCWLFVPASSDPSDKTGDCLYALNQAEQFKTFKAACELLFGLSGEALAGTPMAGMLGPMFSMLGIRKPKKKVKPR